MNNDRMQAGMAEATRLVRAGRLAEATALIQRTLAGVPATNVSAAEPNRAGAPIEAEFRVLDDSSPSMETSVGGAAGGDEARGPRRRHEHDHGGQQQHRRAAAGRKAQPLEVRR